MEGIKVKETTIEKIMRHPCFNDGAKAKFGRVHLPVAPKCNVQCNYCNRKFDCVNESRPGVSSVILLPWQTPQYMDTITAKGTDIAVAGIAGPGDPLANPIETFDTIKFVKEKHPDLLFCLSTNGVEVSNYIKEIVENNVSHVTITMNAIDPDVVSQIYSWIRYNKKIYRGAEIGTILPGLQSEAIKLLKAHNIIVKINSIIIPGINDKHIVDVARHVADLGADIMNCIPVYPNKDTAFEDIEEPSRQMVYDIQKQISEYIKPMKHCARCRADAAGLLGKDIADTVSVLQEVTSKPLPVNQARPYVAAASFEGILVNQHLGEAKEFYIFENTPNGYVNIARRQAPKAGSGDIRWIQLAKTLSDCNTLLTNGIGANPMSILKNMGLKIMQMNGLIEAGLDAVYKGSSITGLNVKKAFKCGESCKGDATGCG